MDGAAGDVYPVSVSRAIISAAPPALRSIAQVTGSPSLSARTSAISLSSAASSLATRLDSFLLPPVSITVQ